MSVIFLLLLFCPCLLALQVLDENYWKKTSYEDLKESLNLKQNKRIAKNVILFIGDGMGPNTVTAARIYKEKEEGYLSWERFDHVGALKTYSNNKMVPDSGCSGTALFAGVKTNVGTLGVSADVQRYDCDGSVLEKNRVTTLAKIAQDAGKATGIVTTARITHATPAAMYAHTANRDWECDTKMPYYAQQCKDIARQLVEDEPGKNFNVIMGGGRQQLMTDSPATPEDPIADGWTCTRADNRNLIAEWARQKEMQGVRYAMPKNKKELLDLDATKTDYLLGIFRNDHFPFAYEINDTVKEIPSLEEMATTAVKVLSNNKKGFFLMVESALIDNAHHSGRPRVALSETIELSKAVQGTMKVLEAAGIKDDTLVIVTSDHSHTLTISGYPDRGSSILGLAGKSEVDNISYTSLNYATAGIANYKYSVVNGSVVREDPSKIDTTSFEYRPQAGVPLVENSHGGSDVFVYATGPYAYLFHRMHEQTYVPEVIQYAFRIGHHGQQILLAKARRSGSSMMASSVILIITMLSMFRLTNFI
ncbi:alkaline phosphatase [Halyomorpha halys]|uniref:alkaline phosphatase n=1 Tax=Halyomorpha halys TaxID=286706 RepID=UPI0006D4EF90|nr:alkaline phosphatase [Halyomorpha halys]